MYDVIESAYNEGYYRALAELGYEYDEYDDAMESGIGIKVNSLMSAILFGTGGVTAYNCVLRSKINNSIVIDIGAMIRNGLSRNDARKYAAKTIKFLISKGYLFKQYAGSEIIRYEDLTESGKRFMDGYYSAIDEIKEFDLEKAKASASLRSPGQLSDKTIFEGAANSLSILSLASSVATLLGTLLPAGLTGMLIGVILSGINLAYYIRSAETDSEFTSGMQGYGYGKESAYYDANEGTKPCNSKHCNSKPSNAKMAEAVRIKRNQMTPTKKVKIEANWDQMADRMHARQLNMDDLEKL